MAKNLILAISFRFKLNSNLKKKTISPIKYHCGNKNRRHGPKLAMAILNSAL